MSGGLKSGLIFALVSIIAVVGFSLIPWLGVPCCGPIATMTLSAIAGYIGVRWSGPTARIGSGTLAGGVSGIGALIGSVIFFWTIAILTSDPVLLDQVVRQALEQQPASGLTEDELRDITRNVIGFFPVIGFCAGLIHLLFAVLLGTLGGWLAVRQRPQPPMAPPAYTVG